MSKAKERKRKTQHQKDVERWMEQFYRMHKLLGSSGEYIMELAESGVFRDDGHREPSDPSTKKLLDELVDDPHREISQAESLGSCRSTVPLSLDCARAAY